MAISTIEIEGLFRKKIKLYHNLVDILEQEKKSLRESDVEALWRFSEKKQRVVGEVEDVRGQILVLLDSMGIAHEFDQPSFQAGSVIACMPEESRAELKALQIELDSVKNKVHSHSKANKNFVEEYLKVLDEMIGVITDAANPQTPYDRNRYPDNAGRANLLLHREA